MNELTGKVMGVLSIVRYKLRTLSEIKRVTCQGCQTIQVV